jgi:hypothetical protein
VAPSGGDQLKLRRCQDDAALAALSASAFEPSSAFAGAVRLTGTIEHWLGITEEREGAWKSANIGASLALAYADPASPLPGKVGRLLTVLGDLFDGVDPAPHRSAADFQGALIERHLPPPAFDLAVEVAAFPRTACTCVMP